PLEGVDELGAFGDPVLEQVAEALRAGSEELARIALLDRLREDEHARGRVAPPELERGADAFVGERRRQANVDDADVRLVLGRSCLELVRGGDGRSDVDLVVIEQSRQRVAQEARVLDDDYAHGISARSTVGPPAGLSSSTVPPSAATRSSRPA